MKNPFQGIWLPETDPVTEWFWRNRFWANAMGYQLFRFPPNGLALADLQYSVPTDLVWTLRATAVKAFERPEMRAALSGDDNACASIRAR